MFRLILQHFNQLIWLSSIVMLEYDWIAAPPVIW